jgi:predicted transcriptional regulator
MTMLSFRVEDTDAEDAQQWAERLGVDRSELLRQALRRHLDRLRSEDDADRWVAQPLDAGESALADVAVTDPGSCSPGTRSPIASVRSSSRP